ncbi:IKI3-like protein [Tanacetum coccineum]
MFPSDLITVHYPIIPLHCPKGCVEWEWEVDSNTGSVVATENTGSNVVGMENEESDGDGTVNGGVGYGEVIVKNGTFDYKSCCKSHGNELATALRKRFDDGSIIAHMRKLTGCPSNVFGDQVPNYDLETDEAALVIFMRFLRGSKDLNVVEVSIHFVLMSQCTNGGAEHGDHDVLKSEIWVWKILEDKLSPQKGAVHGDESAIIIQTTRRNLGSIYPRNLVLESIGNALVHGHFKDALLMVRQHTIDFNVTVDHGVASLSTIGIRVC